MNEQTPEWVKGQEIGRTFIAEDELGLEESVSRSSDADFERLADELGDTVASQFDEMCQHQLVNQTNVAR